MTVIEFGSQNAPVIMLLHGGGLSWWNYKEEAELLKEKYHVLLPILNGHADSDLPFTTIEDNATKLIEYIDEKYHGNILAIGGLSLGGQILIDMLCQRKDICKYALIESALVVPMPFTNSLIAPVFGMSYGLIKKKWFARMQFSSLKIKEDLFEDYYRDTCKLTKKNMISFLKANSSYEMKSDISKTLSKVLIIVGGKEQVKMKKSAVLIHEMVAESRLQVIDGYYHGELSLNNAGDYVKMLIELV